MENIKIETASPENKEAEETLQQTQIDKTIMTQNEIQALIAKEGSFEDLAPTKIKKIFDLVSPFAQALLKLGLITSSAFMIIDAVRSGNMAQDGLPMTAENYEFMAGIVTGLGGLMKVFKNFKLPGYSNI